MKTLIVILILAVFFQTSFVPINLLLIIIFARSLIVEEKINYFLAFIFGLLLGILSSQNLGFWPAVLLVAVKIGHLLKKLPFSTNLFTVTPISFLVIYLAHLLESSIFGKSIQINLVLIEGIFCLPAYLLIKVFEEKFIFKPEIKLRIRQ